MTHLVEQAQRPWRRYFRTEVVEAQNGSSPPILYHDVIHELLSRIANEKRLFLDGIPKSMASTTLVHYLHTQLRKRGGIEPIGPCEVVAVQIQNANPSATQSPHRKTTARGVDADYSCAKEQDSKKRRKYLDGGASSVTVAFATVATPMGADMYVRHLAGDENSTSPVLLDPIVEGCESSSFTLKGSIRPRVRRPAHYYPLGIERPHPRILLQALPSTFSMDPDMQERSVVVLGLRDFTYNDLDLAHMFSMFGDLEGLWHARDTEGGTLGRAVLIYTTKRAADNAIQAASLPIQKEASLDDRVVKKNKLCQSGGTPGLKLQVISYSAYLLKKKGISKHPGNSGDHHVDSPSQSSSQPLICPFYVVGRCSKGVRCRSSHDPQDIPCPAESLTPEEILSFRTLSLQSVGESSDPTFTPSCRAFTAHQKSKLAENIPSCCPYAHGLPPSHRNRILLRKYCQVTVDYSKPPPSCSMCANQKDAIQRTFQWILARTTKNSMISKQSNIPTAKGGVQKKLALPPDLDVHCTPSKCWRLCF